MGVLGVGVLERLGERGGSEGLRDCVCVDAGDGEGQSERCNALLN